MHVTPVTYMIINSITVTLEVGGITIKDNELNLKDNVSVSRRKVRVGLTRLVRYSQQQSTLHFQALCQCTSVLAQDRGVTTIIPAIYIRKASILILNLIRTQQTPNMTKQTQFLPS